MTIVEKSFKIFEQAQRDFKPGSLVVIRKKGEVIGKGKLLAHGFAIEAGFKKNAMNYITVETILEKEKQAFFLMDDVEFEFGEMPDKEGEKG